jgi:hypothetical protein
VKKLNHYYDKVSPMVGISLLLNPSYKKQMLIESLKWKKEWVDSVMAHFKSSFSYYKDKFGSISYSNNITTSAVEPEGEFFSFLKRRRTDTADIGEEYTRCISA